MKLKFPFEIVTVDDETVAVPVGDDAEGFHAVFQINETTADILKLLNRDISKDELCKKMLKLYDVGEDQLMPHIDRVLETLRKDALLDE